MTPTLPPGSNGTGIEYPTIELGGKTYTVKFSRGGILYRLSKTGTTYTGGSMSFSLMVDILHAGLFGQYEKSAEELADLVVSDDKAKQATAAVTEALKKFSRRKEAQWRRERKR